MYQRPQVQALENSYTASGRAPGPPQSGRPSPLFSVGASEHWRGQINGFRLSFYYELVTYVVAATVQLLSAILTELKVIENIVSFQWIKTAVALLSCTSEKAFNVAYCPLLL